jgi:hypothetical protein
MAEQSDDEREADAKTAGDLPKRSFAVFDRGGDALSEIHGIGPHPPPPLQTFIFLHFTVWAFQ